MHVVISESIAVVTENTGIVRDAGPVRANQILNGLSIAAPIAIGSLTALMMGASAVPSSTTYGVFGVFFVLNVIGLGIGLHRYFTHAAFRTSAFRTPLREIGRCLSSDDPALAAWLRFGIADAIAGRGGRVRTFIDRLGRSYRVSVDRLEGTNGHLACVRVRDEQAALQRNVDGARATFGFTIAESRLAEALLKGATPAQFAIAKGVRMPTVRSQLRSLFAKTGVTGQNELLIILNSGGQVQSQ